MKPDAILVPLDGSSLAETALPKAVELARDSGGRLLLLRAVEARTLPGIDPIDAQTQVIEEAERYLREVADGLEAQGFTKIDRTVWYGSPARAIVEAARLLPVNLIVMATHGRGGFGCPIGSVAESVLRATARPLLLIRPEGAPVDERELGRERPWPVARTAHRANLWALATVA